eukprot:gene12275-12361_t
MTGSDHQKADPKYASVSRFETGEQELTRSRGAKMPTRQVALADLCRRLVTEAYVPAAVLVNRQYDCLYSMGPTERYLRIAPGHPSHNLFSMTPPSFQNKLRSAVQRADRDGSNIVVSGCQNDLDAAAMPFSIVVQSVVSDDERLLLVCFLDAPKWLETVGAPESGLQFSQISALEAELDGVRIALEEALHRLEIAEDTRALDDEPHQRGRDEPQGSHEKLQAQNQELTMQIRKLQQQLDGYAAAANDLRNVLFSTDVATLFLDIHLNIRLFTPAMVSFFRILPGDIGRPLADLSALVADSSLLEDARNVLLKSDAIEREISTQSGGWFIRRISLCLTDGRGIEGVVITFTDITERKAIADALKIAKAQAQLANAAKSRFLAAASHDLRQPMQTLALLQGILAVKVEGEKEQKLLVRFDDTLSAMSSMLNTLLDINQIEAGTVRTDIVSFPVNQLLLSLRDEFSYSAQAQDISFILVPCRCIIRSDMRLLEQMIRNLLSNAFKYTKKGRVLLGCRRRGNLLRIEVWDTGIGVPQSEWQSIFEEYHQLDNEARERNRGLGLGLAIVQNLGKLLDHHIDVASRPDIGSVFTIEVPITTLDLAGSSSTIHLNSAEAKPQPQRTGTVLVIEDEPEVRDLLDIFLKAEGHRTITAADGAAALAILEQSAIRPDLILADYNLPGGMDGLQITTKLRKKFHSQVPVIILTGDISAATLRRIAEHDCVQLNKPVKLKALSEVVKRLLPAEPDALIAISDGVASSAVPVVFVVDDDKHIRDAIRTLLEDEGRVVEDFESCEAFLAAFKAGAEACLLIDAYLPATEQISGLTKRQHEIMAMVLAGHPSKNIAADLGISQRTVENHRASIMKKTGSKSLPALARLAMTASE